MGGIEEIHERVTRAFGAITQEDWDRTPASLINLNKIIADCFREEAEKIRQLEQRIVMLEQENQILREQLGRNSGNSSMPPSSDIKSVTGKKQRKGKSGKRRGGQPGHIGYTRNLIPAEECQKVEDHYPEECKKCGALLSGEDPAPYRHQVVDIPPITPQVEEHRLHKLTCKGCGTETRASLPENVSLSGYSERVMAIVALLGGVYRASERMTKAAMKDLFGVDVSLGTVDQIRQEVSAAVEEAVEEARNFVKEQPVVHADETGFRQGNADGKNPSGRKAWLWVAVTEMVTVFQVGLSRGQEAAKELLGEAFAGILNSDRWNGYNWVKTARRQLCWAHLKREFQKIAERGGENGKIGQKLLEEEEKLFRLWHCVRDGTMSRAMFKTKTKKIRRRVKTLLEEGADYRLQNGDKNLRAKTARTCRDLLKLEKAMWLFVKEEGLEPTNNKAEKAIRPAVLWRNVSFGTQSEEGSKFVARMLTVVTTLRLQERNVLEFLCEASRAHRLGSFSPSLLPAPFQSPSNSAIAA